MDCRPFSCFELFGRLPVAGLDISQKTWRFSFLGSLTTIVILRFLLMTMIMHKGAVTPCNFPCNLSHKLRRKLHSVTEAVLQFFLFCVALHEVELRSTFCNALQQLATPLHSISPFQQLCSQFLETLSLTAHAQGFFRIFLPTVFLNFPPNISPPAKKNYKLLRKLRSLTGLFLQ